MSSYWDADGSTRRRAKKLYSYIVRHDSGFSPNPFWGYCTLACCKPAIRRTAMIGDWIVGLSPKATGNRVIFAMLVEELLGHDQYYEDCRFRSKIPDYTKDLVVYKSGDNIYRPLPYGDFQQLQSMHSNGMSENPETKMKDLGGRNVLISKTFYYFGSRALDLPEQFNVLRVGRAHKNHFPSGLVSAFIDFVRTQIAGVNAAPTSWPANDDSWKAANQ